jgi:hypothetical protein
MENMKTSRHWRGACLAGLFLGFTALTGCQTWVAGMTLPSGWYLQHPPQYFPPSPPFPLSRELARQEDIAAAPGPAGLPVGPLPAQVPGQLQP